MEVFAAMRKRVLQPAMAGRNWLWLSALVAILVVLPVFALAIEAIQGSAGLWGIC